MKRSLESRMTSKGQVTVPVEIRRKLGLTTRDHVVFEVDGNAVRIRAAASEGLRAGYGAVTAPLTNETFQSIRDQMEEEISQEVLSETR